MNEIQTTELNQIEVEINFYKGQAVQSIFEIGERLIKAKKLVDHGEWEDWLKDKVNFSNRQARRFMQVVEQFPNRTLATTLGNTKVFELLTLPKEQIEEFVEVNPVEDMTKLELRQAIKEKKELEKQLEETQYKYNEVVNKNTKLLEQEPTVIEKEVPVEVVPDDYNYYKKSAEKLQDQVRNLKRNLEDKESNLESVKSQIEILERKAKLNENDSIKYKQLKDQIENLSKQKDDLGRQIKSRTELSGLVVRIENMLKTELAPIKYSRAINEAKNDEIVIKNLNEIVGRVEDWCYEMKNYTNNTNIIKAEVINYD